MAFISAIFHPPKELGWNWTICLTFPSHGPCIQITMLLALPAHKPQTFYSCHMGCRVCSGDMTPLEWCSYRWVHGLGGSPRLSCSYSSFFCHQPSLYISNQGSPTRTSDHPHRSPRGVHLQPWFALLGSTTTTSVASLPLSVWPRFLTSFFCAPSALLAPPQPPATVSHLIC